MNALELLRVGRSRLEQGHARGVYARDAGGCEVLPWADSACAWCVLGSLRHGFGFSTPVYHKAVGLLYAALPGNLVQLTTFADIATQADVLVLFDRAIAAAEVA